MNRKRWFHAALLLVYVLLLVGVQFHTHTAGVDQLTAHCKSCQLSQSTYENVHTKDLHHSDAVTQFSQPLSDTLVVRKLCKLASGRAPPLA